MSSSSSFHYDTPRPLMYDVPRTSRCQSCSTSIMESCKPRWAGWQHINPLNSVLCTHLWSVSATMSNAYFLLLSSTCQHSLTCVHQWARKWGRSGWQWLWSDPGPYRDTPLLCPSLIHKQRQTIPGPCPHTKWEHLRKLPSHTLTKEHSAHIIASYHMHHCLPNLLLLDHS